MMTAKSWALGVNSDEGSTAPQLSHLCRYFGESGRKGHNLALPGGDGPLVGLDARPAANRR